MYLIFWKTDICHFKDEYNLYLHVGKCVRQPPPWCLLSAGINVVPEYLFIAGVDLLQIRTGFLLQMILFFKSSGFQVQAEVFLFFYRFDAEIILWLFVDYGEKYALLLHLDRFYWFYRCSTSKNIFWRKSQPRVHPFKYVFNIFFEFRKFRPQYFYIKYILIKKMKCITNDDSLF